MIEQQRERMYAAIANLMDALTSLVVMAQQVLSRELAKEGPNVRKRDPQTR